MTKKQTIISWIIILVLLLITLFSCSPLKRLERLQKHHPYLFEAKIDTLKYVDTVKITIPGVHVDTAVHQSRLIDTVVIFKDNVKTVVWQVNDTVFVDTKVFDRDTVFIYRKDIPVTRYHVEPPKKTLKKEIMELLLITFFLILPIFIILLLLKNKINK